MTSQRGRVVHNLGRLNLTVGDVISYVHRNHDPELFIGPDGGIYKISRDMSICMIFTMNGIPLGVKDLTPITRSYNPAGYRLPVASWDRLLLDGDEPTWFTEAKLAYMFAPIMP